jgi:hypothetical protein
MGSKGNTTTTQQNQNYTPNAPVGAAGSQAINTAQGLSQSPFSMPVAPVAGFTPFQNQAFGATQQQLGMAQPYMQAGAGYLGQSAAPITGQDVSQYYNPMAANVFGQMQNIFGQQQRNTTGQLTQAAGGVGADRIAVGQSELANQQGLAAGQTAAGLYQQALQAAQQQKQMEAGAGYGMSQLGPAAQAAQLQSIGALGAAGGQQQQLAQAQQNAQYQNQLAQIAWPYQNNQYLASITAGLAPALGGSQAGQSTTTGPTPSPLNQILGVGTAAAGLFLNRGGAVGYADGGSPYGKLADAAYRRDLSSMIPTAEAGNPYTAEALGAIGGSLPTFAAGGDIQQMMQQQEQAPPPVPGAALPNSGGMAPIPTLGATIPTTPGSAPIPYMSSRPFGGQYHNTLDLKPASTKVPAGQETLGGDISQGIKLAQKLDDSFSGDSGSGNYGGTGGDLGALYARGGASGGAVNPYDMGRGFAPGGDTAYDPSGDDLYGDSGPAGPVVDVMKQQWNDAGAPLTESLRAGTPAAASTGESGSSGMDESGMRLSPVQAASPMGNPPMPRARPDVAGYSLPEQGTVQHSASQAWKEAGMSPTGVGGIFMNIPDESNWNPNLRHPDQPAYSGEAHYAHGLYQEGGAEWNRYQRWLGQQGHDPTTEWNNPDLQNQFTAWNLKTNYPRVWDQMYNAKTPGEAGAAFVRGYLKPAQHFQEARASKYLGTSGGVTPATYAERGEPLPSSPLNADMTPNHYRMPGNQLPYQNLAQEQQGYGARLARNPNALALMKAGAAIASTAGPVGTAIGRGFGAAAGSLEGSRAAIRTDEQVNQKAQSIYQQAVEHLDHYQRKTPHEAAIESMGRFTPINYTNPETGQVQVGRFDARHGILSDSQGNPVQAGRILGRNAAAAGMSENQAITQARNLVQIPGSKYWGKDPLEVAKELMHSEASPTGATPSAATAEPDPGAGKRVKGKWYIGPSGKPQQWLG